MKKALTVGLIVLLVLVGGGVLIAKPADAATPADPLYTVDLLAESIQRLITLDPVAKAELEQMILDERAEELTAISEDETLATDENLTKAIDALDSQNTRVKTRISDLEGQEGLQDGALEQVQNRYENQVQEQKAYMNQIQSEVKNMGEDTQIKLETTLKNIDSQNSDTSGGNDNSTSGNDSSGSSGSSNTPAGGTSGNGKN